MQGAGIYINMPAPCTTLKFKHFIRHLFFLCTFAIQLTGKELNMTAIEIKAKERELIKEIDSDSSLLDSALRYVRKLKKAKLQTPCQFTAVEKENILLKGEQDAKNGLGILHEDLEKDFVSW